ncbi:MAG: hypothetical protein CM15mV10_1250 [uncultured marine virus]|nr:MAG: hypothetical protein CM15mV10_1250 [uncultured marine virus]
MGILSNRGRGFKQWRSTQPPVNTSTVTVTPSQSATSASGVNVSGTVTSSFDSLDFSQANNFTISTSEAFQFTQTIGSGMTNQTIIQRTPLSKVSQIQQVRLRNSDHN